MLTDQIWERDKNDSKGFGSSNGRIELLLMMRGKNTGEAGLVGISGAQLWTGWDGTDYKTTMWKS